MQLTDSQQLAVSEIVANILDKSVKEMSLSGPSGAGKTTVLKEVINMYKQVVSLLPEPPVHNINFLFTATTNKAASVLSDALGTNQFDVTTVYKALGLYLNHKKQLVRAKGARRSYMPHNTVLFIDEASMLDSALHKYLKEDNFFKIVYIGDEYQLPPVNTTAVPVFDSTFIPNQSRLTKIMRQPDGNPIQELTYGLQNLVKTGVFPEADVNGIDILWLDSKDFLQSFVEDCANNPVGTVKALTWTNQSAINYNENAIRHCNSRTDFIKGDLVNVNSMVISGSHKINTDTVVRITGLGEWEIDRYGVESRKVQLNGYHTFSYYRDRPTFLKRMEELSDVVATELQCKHYVDLRYLYASTITKSQGSSYETVYVDLPNIGQCKDRGLVHRMLYVAASRATKKLVFTGDL